MNKENRNRSGMRQRGQALVEFALVSPVLLMLAFGIIDFARTMFVYSMTLDALRDASRNASVLGYGAEASVTPRYMDCDRIAGEFSDMLFMGDLTGNVTVEHELVKPDGSTEVKDCTAVSDSDLENGDILHVSVTVDIEFITPIAPLIPNIGTVYKDGVYTLNLTSARTIVKQIELGNPNSNDTDFDGLDDDWEMTHCGDLSCTALDDNDGDGLTNGREETLLTNPNDVDTDGDGLNDRDEVDVYSTDPLVPDTDGDGLTDAEEVLTYGTDPNLTDTDGDGLTDGEEVFGNHPANTNGYRSSPTNTDTDGDGVNDFDEIMAGTNPSEGDTDFDGLSDFDEINVYGTNPLLPDTDGDGLLDPSEINIHGTDPNVADTDGDGLSDGVEVNTYGTNPLSPDSDGDRLSDGAEINTYGTDPLDPDGDHDNLSDYAEIIAGTDPNNSDTDDDGLTDFQEVVIYTTEPTNFDPTLYDTYTGDAYANDYDYLVGNGGNPGADLQDTDADGLPDTWEIRWWGTPPDNICNPGGVVNTTITDPLQCQSGTDDFDSDGYSNYFELINGTNPRQGDTDGDGISDGNEVFTFGTDPENPDTDGDRLLDGQEVFDYTTNPLLIDTDGDGLQDGEEVFGDHPLNVNGYKTDPKLFDTDGDGLSDYDEIVTYGTNPRNVDTDGDGLQDGAEVNTYGTDPTNIDTDGDGLQDGAEVFTHNTNPTLIDTDGDGLNDGAEVNTYSTDPNDTDTDNDGLLDGEEVNTYGTDPLLEDTDGDLLKDGDEVNTYSTDPAVFDTDGDGLGDGAEILVHLTYPLDPDSEDDGVNDGDEINNPDGYQSSDPFDPNSDQADEDFFDTYCNSQALKDELALSGIPTSAPHDPTVVGFDDYLEVQYGTNPSDWDTDGDGFGDCEEIATGGNPLDAPRLYIDDVTITEPVRSNDTVNMIFTVSLKDSTGALLPAGNTVTVNYTTVDFTAIAGKDYTFNRGRVTFNVGQSQATITIVVNGDQGAGSVEGTETFNVNLSNAVGARIEDPTGVGTILDQD